MTDVRTKSLGTSRFRYSLRAFIVLVTLLCLVLGYVTHEVRRQSSILAELKRLRAGISYYSDSPSWPHDAFDMRLLTRIRTIDLRGSDVRDISALGHLTNLEVLHLWASQISDLTPLKRLTKLKLLDLYGTQLTDASVLAGMSSLEHLNLHNMQMSTLLDLVRLPSLKLLILYETQITEDDLAKLRKMMPHCSIEVQNQELRPRPVALGK